LKLSKVSFLIVAAMLGYAVPATANEDDKLQALMQNYWDSYLQAVPLTATFIGVSSDNTKLDDVSDAGLKKNKKLLANAISGLSDIDINRLTADNQTNYHVFEWLVKHEYKTASSNVGQLAFSTIDGWQSRVGALPRLTTFNSAADYKNYIKRLSAIGAYADQNIALLQKGIESGYVQPCEPLEGYEGSISGFISETAETSGFYAPFLKVTATVDAETVKALQIEAQGVIADVVNPAYQRYLSFFTDTYKPACRNNVGLYSVPNGRAAYNHLVKYYTTLDTDADTVHTLGLREVKRIRAEMDAIIAEVDFGGSFAEFLEHLRTDPKFYPDDAERYIARASALAKRIDGELPKYFSYLPRNPYGIKPVPDAIAPKTTTGYYSPGAQDGTRAGTYYLNTYNLKSRPLYELAALTLHEGVPGHHLQIAIQSELGDLPDFRRAYYFHAYGEGWGLYSEYLGLEMGMYDTPYDRFGKLIYEMWRACRLVVDSGMHAKGWSRQQAIDFMASNTALSLHNITSEVDRYITYPGQALAYKHGELKIRELRARAEKALGEAFSLRDFHTVILTSGPVPLTVLDSIVSGWITTQKQEVGS